MFRGLGHASSISENDSAMDVLQVESLLAAVYRDLRPQHFEVREPTTALRQLLEHVLQDHLPQASRVEKERWLQRLLSEMTGYGPLEELMQRNGVTDIQAIGPQTIHFTSEGRRQVYTQESFRNEEHCRQFVHRLAIQCGRTFDESTREVDLDLTDGSRLHAIKTASGTVITIRRPSTFPGFSFLVQHGILTEPAITFLKAVQQRKLTWIVAGNTGSMKTTLIQLLLSSDCIPASRVVGVMEEKKELNPALPFVISMEEVLPRSDGQGGYKLRQYVRAAMRMYLDVFVIGELRGAEALDALRAANSGHQIISSIHAGSPEQAIAALKTLSLSAEQVPERVIDDLIGEGIRFVIQMERAEGRNGYRVYMKSICEVIREGRRVISRPVFRFEQRGAGSDGLPEGKLVYVGISDQLRMDFQAWAIDPSIWEGERA